MFSPSKDVERKKQHTNGDSRTNTCTITITIQQYYTKQRKSLAYIQEIKRSFLSSNVK
jgi:hypothetical protein